MKDPIPYGVIFPIPIDIIDRLFKNKVVFVKYPTHEVIGDRLKACKKMLFYASRANKEIVGEGNINQIELLSKEQVLKDYINVLFLNKEELEEYSRGGTKKLLVFSLENSTKYKVPVSLDHPITMVGEYISQEDYNEIIEQSRGT